MIIGRIVCMKAMTTGTGVLTVSAGEKVSELSGDLDQDKPDTRTTAKKHTI